MPAASLSPMMQQYREAKQAAGDALLLFRMGDFYELFYDDAKTAARTLGLALTSRDKGDDPVPMAGFPHHQLDSYLAKIISSGHRAAVCEQVENPKQAKGLVKRAVTRIVTPGTLTDDALLDPQSSNFLAAVVQSSTSKPPAPPAGIAWVDVSTGRFYAAAFPPEQVADQLARIGPAELLTSDEAPPLPADWTNGDFPDRPRRLDIRPHHRARNAHQTFRRPVTRRFRFRCGVGIRYCRTARCRRGAQLSGGDPESFARPYQPTRGVFFARSAGD